MVDRVTGKKLSTMIGRMLPDFVTENHENFALFIQKYFEYLEEDGNSYELAANALLYADIDDTIDDFIEHFRTQFADDIPRKFTFLDSSANIQGDIRFIIKQIRDYYLTKGSELSYEFIFRIIYGIEIKFYYPKIDILRCSDGKWHVPYSLVLTTTPNGIVWDDVFIRGKTSGAKAYLDTHILYEFPHGSNYYRAALSLLEVTGTFFENEDIEIIGNESEILTITGSSHTHAGQTVVDSSGVIEGQGRWTNNDGFLSSDKFIQDNDYYQDYSYEIQTYITRDVYENLIKRIIHPAGLKFFGKLAAQNITVHVPYFKVYPKWDISWLKEVTNTPPVLDSIVSYTTLKSKNEVGGMSWAGVERQIISSRGHYKDMSLTEMDREFPRITVGMFDSNSVNNGCIVSVNGTQINNFSIYQDELTLGQTYANGDELSVYSLGERTEDKTTLTGTGSIKTFSVSSLGATTIEELLVFVDGIKQLINTELSMSGSDIVFVTAPSVGANIDIYKIDPFRDHQSLSGDGITRIFTLPEAALQANDDNVMVFVDGKRINVVINNKNEIILKTISPIGTNNIEIIYLNRVTETNETFILDGTSLQYTLNDTPNIFGYTRESYLTIN
jgi:hypothetical protein